MIQKTIDCYGHANTSEHFRRTEEIPDEVKTDSSGNTYLRYGTGANCAIHRIDGTDGMTRRWTFGAWDERERLTYSAGMQDTITITVEG